jgi:origin recognition complex subunit 3
VENVKNGQRVISYLVSATSVLEAIRNSISRTPYVPRSTLYVRAASGELDGSPIIRETLLMVRKASSDLLYQILEALSTLKGCYFPIDVTTYKQELDSLAKENTNGTMLRSLHDIRNNTLRTTIVAQKVELSKQRSTLSEQDTTYSELVGRFYDDVERYFTDTLVSPQSVILSEILFYDLKSPHSETFAPKPRFVLERSLSSPHDYLSCSCCSDSGGRDVEVRLQFSQ